MDILTYRVLAFIALIFVSIFLPLLPAVGLFVIFAVFLRGYWEGVLAGVFLDALYPSPNFLSGLHLGFFTAAFIITLAVIAVLKNVIQGQNLFSKIIIAILGACPVLLFLILSY